MKKVLLGILLGISYLIPGFCSASLAIGIGVYKDLLEVMSSFYKLKTIRKHALFLVGMIIGFVLGIIIYNLLFDKYSYYFIAIFLGFILSGIRSNIRKGFKMHNKIICYIIVFIIILVINIIGNNRLNLISINYNGYYYLYIFMIAFIASVALILPGISGSMILFLFGIYDEILKSVNGLFTNLFLFQPLTPRFFMPIIIFISGFLLGILAFSKIIDIFIENKKEHFVDITNAFIVATSCILFITIFKQSLFKFEFIICFVFIVFGYYTSKLINKK